MSYCASKMSHLEIALYHMNDMDTTTNSTTPAQSRTRTAILKAAVQVLTRDRSAPLNEVARKAEVARSTLHRYFPERSDLLEAVSEYARAKADEVESNCNLEDGVTVDGMVRLALEYFERWDAIMWAYGDTWESDNQQPEDDLSAELGAAIIQAQGRGEIDASLPADWIQHLMFAIVYTSWEYERTGHPHAEAAMMVMTAMRKLLSPSGTVVTPPQR